MDDRGELAVHTWLLLWRATRSVERHAHRHIESLDLCPSDFAVLEALLHRGAMPVNAIGRRVLLTSGSITTAVDRLEHRGLVERRADPADRRARVVHLSRAGRRLIAPAFAAHAEVLTEAMSDLTADDQRRLIDLLRTLGHGARQRFDRTTDPT